MKLLWLLVGVLLCWEVSAQENTQTPTVWGLQAHSGFIIPHAAGLRQLAQSKPWGLQLDWSKLLLQQKAWNSCNCFSQVGLSASYINFGNPKNLGNAYSMVFFSEPYLSFRQKLHFSFRAGIGPSYLNRVYHKETNPENTFYSANLSFLLLANFTVNYALNDRLNLLLAAYYNHISNGGWKQPNKGINFPTLTLGLRYLPEKIAFVAWPRVTPSRKKLVAYTRLFAASTRVGEDSLHASVRRLQLGLAAGTYYFLGPLNALNTGVEIVREGGQKEKRDRLGRSYDYHSFGILMGHNFVFGRFTFGQQMGWYVYRPYPSDNPNFYQRYELLYRLGHLRIGTGLKAHGNTAENIDLRMGWVFE